MNASFCDTNVLLYLIGADGPKASKAERLLRTTPTISVQVLNEFAHAARRKSMRSWAQIRDMLGLIGKMVEVVPVTLDVHVAGLALVERHGFSIYDAMIVAAALEADCTTLWSEDMHDGLTVAGRLIIRNPFA